MDYSSQLAERGTTADDGLVSRANLHLDTFEGAVASRPISICRSFLKFLPTMEGRTAVADDILACTSNEMLEGLSQHYTTAILIPAKAAGAKTANVTPHPVEDNIPNDLRPGALLPEIERQRREQGMLKQKALIRDQYRCILTSILDDSQDPGDDTVTEITDETICAHILPFLLGRGGDDERIGVDKLAAIWSCIHRLFPTLRQMAFGASRINSLSNVITLCVVLHNKFGSFDWCLVPTQENPETYIFREFKKIPGLYRPHLPTNGIVKLATTDPYLELPSRELLLAHSALAHIFHATGMGEEIDSWIEEWDTCRVLATNGLPPALLNAKLLSVC